MRNLPMGISEFAELRRKNCLYIDKTKHVYHLLKNNNKTFLARPRRFGKSLLVSTLTAALQGKKELFSNLWIANSDYVWDSYGVIRLDFSVLDSKTPEIFEQALTEVLIHTAKDQHVIIDSHFLGVKSALAAVAKSLYAKFGKVALLIDEYDYPILHALHSQETAIAIRSILKDFSTAAKAMQTHIEFVFVTGVSAFSKSGLSSGLNNLTNLTMLDQFATICGYTEEEIKNNFAPHIASWAQCCNISCAEIQTNLRAWYNGYRFTENAETVYSPFSVTSALFANKMANFWFESAAPQFLLDEIAKMQRQEECHLILEKEFSGSMETLQTFEIEQVPLIALLFQMGYLTINTYDSITRIYTLKYPNLEVKTALHYHIVLATTKISHNNFDSILLHLVYTLEQVNIEQFIDFLRTIFAKIPYWLQDKKEKFYHVILQAVFIAANLRSQAEYSSSLGRADIVLELPSKIYILEIKIDTDPKQGLEQIETQKYYEPFLHENKSIYGLALSFTSNDSTSINYLLKQFT